MKHLVLLIFLILAACSKPDQNPELKDDIYKDLVSRVSFSEAALLVAEDKINKQKEEVRNENRDYYRKRQVAKLQDLEKQKTKLAQEIKYLKTRVETRRIFVKRAYTEARKVGKELDLSEEYSKYNKYKQYRSDLSLTKPSSSTDSTEKDEPSEGASNSESGEEVSPEE